MICTDRDTDIIKKVGLYGILSTDQIARSFFSRTALTTVRRRLRALEEAGYLVRLNGLDNGGVVWTASKMSAVKFGYPFVNRLFNRNSLSHDVLLSEVRQSLESVGLGESWVPEHVLKVKAVALKGDKSRERSFVPDAIMTVQQGQTKKIVALELELSRKNHKRYEAIFGRYKSKKSLWAVWYLVRDMSHGKLLEHVWRRANGGHRNDLLMWSVLDQVIQKPRDAFVRSEHFSMPLKNLVLTKSPEGAALPGALPKSIPKVEVAGALREAVS